MCLLPIVLAGAGCREEGDIRIADLDFNGVEQVDEGALLGALQTKKGSWLPWGRKRYFDRRAFEADLKRIQAFYSDRGFPDARVTSFDVQLNDSQDEVSITLDIREGEPTRVDALVLEGFDVLEPHERDDLLATMPLRPEAPLDRQLAVASRERAANALRDKGYPYADVRLTEEEAGVRRRRIRLAATPGVLARFGPVEIAGQHSVDEQVVARELTFAPGELFTRRKTRESQRQIYGLELFEFANVESLEDAELQLEEVPIRVTVVEGKHRRVNLGLGYGTEENGRARLRWEHLNVRGGAQKVGVEGKWSSLDRGVRADYREPFFLRPHVSLGFEGQAWQAAEPVYSVNRAGGRVTMRYQPNPQNSWSLSFANEYQRSRVSRQALMDFTVRDELISLGLDPRDGQDSGTLSALAFDVSRSTTDSLLDARRGYVLNARVEQAGTWLGGSYDFYAITGEARHYFTIGRHVVLANRLQLGNIDPRETDANVPFYRRFFLGGATSIRGWGRYEVSPLSGFGFPIGGHSMLIGSTEVRLPLFGRLGAVVFADAGNVWTRAWDMDVGDLRYAVGPGLRYLTPIGPARIDVGFQLNPIDNLLVNGEPQQRRWRIHFSIGQAF